MSAAVEEHEGLRFDAIGPERVHRYYSARTGLRAVVVIDTTRFGLSGGGVRMAPDVTAAEVARLARAMTYKYALLGMPIGGAKAGVACDPQSPARGEAVAWFLDAIAPLVQSGAFIPAADMGTSAADFARVYGAAAEGLGAASYEGMPLEDQLTGYGVVVAAREAAGGSLEGARVAVEGFGKVGAGAVKFFAREGAKVVAVSTAEGALYDPEGLDTDALLALRAAHGDAALSRATRGERIAREALYALPVDVLVPGARPDALHAGNVGGVRARFIVPAANAPYAEGAVSALRARGIVALPDFVANAGGVLAVATGVQGGSADEAFAAVREKIADGVRRVMARAKEAGCAEYDAAVALAREALEG